MSIHLEKIRAFQYNPKILVLVLIHIFPTFSIFTCKKQYPSLLIFQCTSQNHIISIVVFPHFGISGIRRMSNLFIMNNGNNFSFLFHIIKMIPIFRNNHSLTGFKLFIFRMMNILVIRFQIFYSRIIYRQLSILFQSCSGKNTVPVIVF